MRCPRCGGLLRASIVPVLCGVHYHCDDCGLEWYEPKKTSCILREGRRGGI